MPFAHHRLYIITGKGGVGKTTVALAFTKYLQNAGVNVLYNSFLESNNEALENKLKIPILKTNINSSAEIYLAQKLNSTTIASWVMKTHFFKALFQMIPGLGHMILLGHLISKLEKDPSLVIVLDSPASGHALTMFESSSNFKNIFKSGLIVKDINKMHQFLKVPNNLKTHIMAEAYELSLLEAQDLKHELDHHLIEIKAHSDLIINNSFKKFFQIKQIDSIPLPDFLEKKLKQEEKMIENYLSLPHIDHIEEVEIINQLSFFMDILV